MALGSKGVRVVILRFSGEDFDQTEDVTSEPRVARHSRSCPLF